MQRKVTISRSRLGGSGLLLLALAVIGCSGRGNVAGTITYKGKAVTWGQVLFEGSDGITRQSSIDKNGGFLVEDLAAGDAKVAVMSPNPKSITLVSKGDKKPGSFPHVPDWVALPDRYEAVAKSGLVYPIKKGENNITIELK